MDESERDWDPSTTVSLDATGSEAGSAESWIVSWKWDLNINIDDDGDGDKTNDVDATGDDWQVSKGLPAYNIVVVDATDAHIADVRSLESRYDTLYVHGSTGLYVEGGRFNRAGRNTMSMVGNDSDFTVEGAHFGPLFGLYLVDLEPWDEQYVQNGTFTGCTFDAVGSGDFPGTSHWGRFLALVAADDQSHDLRLESCTFDKAYVRPVGTWVGLEVDDCSFEMNGDFAFVDADYPSYPVLQDATIENSVFMDYGKPSTDVVYGVSFTGECSWSGNDPSELDDGRECDTED